MITVGVPTYCGAERGDHDLLGLCLAAVRVRTYPNESAYDLIVVDDSGKPEHRAKSRVIAERFGARWLYHDTNRGVAAAWNTLVRSTSTPYVALLNDDFFVSPGWLKALVFFLDNNPNTGTVGCYYYFCNPTDVPQLLTSPSATIVPCHPITKEYITSSINKHSGQEHPGRCMAAPGCGFAFTREKYNLVGGFDESLGKGTYEESDFGTSLASHGFPAYALQYPACYTIMSATFVRAPEVCAEIARNPPRAKYIKKWGTHTEETHARYMGKIPFQTIRWLDPTGPREDLVVSEHGFYSETTR